jgi:hypothetical protein
MASVPVAELPPYTKKNGASSIGFSPGSGSPIVMYRLCPIVVIPTPNVAVSSKDRDSGIFARCPSRTRAYSAKAPSSSELLMMVSR